MKSHVSNNNTTSLKLMKNQAYLTILIVLIVNVNSRPKTKHYLVDTEGKYQTLYVACQIKNLYSETKPLVGSGKIEDG